MIAERAWWNTYHIFVYDYPEKSPSKQVSITRVEGICSGSILYIA